MLLLRFLATLLTWDTILAQTESVWVEKQVANFDLDLWIDVVDSNKDGIILAEEKAAELLKSDANNDGIVHLCELAPFIRDKYHLDLRLGLFLPSDNEGVLPMEAATTEFLASIDVDKDGKVTVDEFREAEFKFISDIANLAYEAVNGPMKSDPINPEIEHDTIKQVVMKMDSNGNGYIDIDDFDVTEPRDRCWFVTVVSAQTGASRWLMNSVFTVMDPNLSGVVDEEFVYAHIYRADLNKDGRTTVQEAVGYIEAQFRVARLYAGLTYKNPWSCDGLEEVENTMVAQIALDMDIDQDGEITSGEMLHYFFLADDNGDKMIQMKEFVNKLVKRYSIHSDLAIEMFKEVDTNDDDLVDFRTDVLFYSLDYNLDGHVTICEGIRAARDWMDIGTKNLDKTDHCRVGDGQECGHKETWKEGVEMREQGDN